MSLDSKISVGKWDLHVHSVCSDGTFQPSEIVKKAAESGISLFSITDHDSIEATKEALESVFDYNKSNSKKILYLPGIEIDAEHHDEQEDVEGIEVLGYGFEPQKLEQFTEKLWQKRAASFETYLKNFTDFLSNPEESGNHMYLTLSSKNLNPHSARLK